jgi:hypothetical protein
MAARSRTTARTKGRGARPNRGTIHSAPDAMLIALGGQFEVLSTELAALEKSTVVAFSPAASPTSELNGETATHPSAERIEAILALLDPIERAIMTTPAASVVGLGVKARHAAHVLSHYWINSANTLDWDMRAVRLLIESTCSVAGAGVQSSQQ